VIGVKEKFQVDDMTKINEKVKQSQGQKKPLNLIISKKLIIVCERLRFTVC
jgi:hypothetical protein